MDSKTSYVVLARKWRPAQFADIVGQSHIVRTLMNAIRAQRIHQAYLFTGSRGIGKTSIARIFAKVIRCEKTADQGEWLRSCDECPSCREIAAGSSLDVIEIDGASNNGVDAVREIRENAKFLPSTGSRKIYIIDEVHMLTTAAFNALLKTLEEPPPQVIFIFATTEPHKIPATILSRCQRFDYKRVTLTQIQNRLAEIAKAEGIEVEPAALALIARAAEGGMRDALSMLDQVIAFSGSKITVSSVRDGIGLIEGQTILGILAAIFGRQPLEAIKWVDQAYQQGHDLKVLTRTLIDFLHGAILAKVGALHSAKHELTEDEWKELGQIAGLRELEEIELIFQALHQGLDWIARSPQPKVVLDVLLIKCATAEALVRIDSDVSPESGTLAAPKTAPSAAPVSKTVASFAPTASAPAVSATPAAAATVTAPLGTTWEGFIEHVRKKKPLLASILEHGSCESLPLSGEGLTIAYSPREAYFREQLQSRAYAEQLSAMLKEYFGKGGRIQIELKEGGESLALRKDREGKERERAAKEAATNHPLIKEAKAIFGGELGPIEIIEPRMEASDHASA